MMIYFLSFLFAFGYALKHNEVLDSNGRFQISWSLSEDLKSIEIEAVVKAEGWMGLGFSPNGGMKGADIVMAWFDEDGESHVSDRYAEGEYLPIVDDVSSIDLISFSKSDGVMTLRFKRFLDSCDDQDVVIEGTSRVIYAFSDDVVAVGGSPSKHGSTQRSTRSVILAQPDPPVADFPEAAEDVESFVFAFDNVDTPGGDRTRYWWRGGRIPAEIDEKVHIIGYEPVIAGEEARAHHLLLYLCDQELSDEELAFVGDSHDPVGNLRRCNFVNPIASWAVGGGRVLLGPEYGFPLGGSPSRSTMLLELHLDVPDESPHTTNAGIRVFYTRKLRENDGATLVVGAGVDDFLLTPPQTERTERIGYCFPGCTETMPEEGTNIVGGFLHMHTLGVEMETRHILADGTETAPLARDRHYDFNLQAATWLEEPRKLMPGDSLITTCTYNSVGRDEFTIGGESTVQEMCLHYLIVYPAPAMRVCGSSGTETLFGDIIAKNGFGGAVPTADEQKRIGKFFERVEDWSNLNTAYEEALFSGKNTVFPYCVNEDGKGMPAAGGPAKPIVVEAGKEYVPPPRVCPVIASEDTEVESGAVEGSVSEAVSVDDETLETARSEQEEGESETDADSSSSLIMSTTIVALSLSQL